MSVVTLAVLLQWALSLFSSVISSDSQYQHISGNWTKNSVFKKWRQIATYRCVLGPLGKMAESEMQLKSLKRLTWMLLLLSHFSHVRLSATP